MWSTRCEELDAERGSRFALHLDSQPATFADILRGWVEETAFRYMFNEIHAEPKSTASNCPHRSRRMVMAGCRVSEPAYRAAHSFVRLVTDTTCRDPGCGSGSATMALSYCLSRIIQQ
jgi:hypothetical protein